MSFFEFIKSRTLLKNIIILFVLLVAGFFVISMLLSSYTHHGETIAVPDLRGMKISKIESVLAEKKLAFKIVDSLFDMEKAPGTILDQDPAPKSQVKERRTIYLTINSTQPPDVKMPDLTDVSYRQAEAMLESFGLVPGEISYRADLAKNAVLEQRYKNQIIKPGKLIPKGSVIDLVLGDGMSDIRVPVPDLIGLTLEEATLELKRASLNVGIINYDDDDHDNPKAKVYKQEPSANGGDLIKEGGNVDLFLK